MLLNLGEHTLILVLPGELRVSNGDEVFVVLPEVLIQELTLETRALVKDRTVGVVLGVERVQNLTQKLVLLLSQVLFI